MGAPRRHVDRIRDQFGRQAEAYRQAQVTRDEKGHAALVALSGAGAGDRVLDVACGPGFLTMAFGARCREVVGLDATPEFVARASEEADERGLSHVSFVLGDADRLDFDSGSFDIVSCRAAFHHFPEPERVLREMARVARPGGRLLVADMLGSEDPARAAVHDEIERLCDPTHVRALPASAFAELFRRLDLTVVHEPRSRLDYELEEWLAHGGPDDAATVRIRQLLEESLERDRCGLEVRAEGGRLHFSHTAAAFVLRAPAA